MLNISTSNEIEFGYHLYQLLEKNCFQKSDNKKAFGGITKGYNF